MLNGDGSCSIAGDPKAAHRTTGTFAVLSQVGLVMGPWAGTTFFVNCRGRYHSNDARGSPAQRTEPRHKPVTPLTRAASAELGVSTHFVNHWDTRSMYSS